MTRTAIGSGAYVDTQGRYWARPWVHRRRTWRRLAAATHRQAQAEAASTNWSAPAANLAALAELYIAGGCPNKRLEPRPASFTADETRRVRTLVRFFGRHKTAEIILPLLPAYKTWRIRHTARGTGERAVDKDLVTLSNILNFGVAMNLVAENRIARGRPRYRRSASVVHCREKAPANADDIHRIGAWCFERVETEIYGWLLLFAMFTGCRQSELLRLRMDATSPDHAGHVQFSRREPVSGYLFLGRRSKGGVDPWSLIGPEFEKMLEAFHRWHSARFPSSPWYFPAATSPASPASRHLLGRALIRACRALGLRQITPHGLRSFYVTKRRSDGASDTAIAGEIGDQTVSLMQTTYGSRPPNWTGGDPLSWLPASGLPCWETWTPSIKTNSITVTHCNAL